MRHRGWGVAPSVLVEEGRRVAPRPIIGFGGVAPDAGKYRFEVGALERLGESLLGVALADLVRENRPELGKASGGRAPFRGRRGDRVRGVRKGGAGGNLRGGRGV